VSNALKPRILCIDDEAPVGELLRQMFEKTGEFVVEVETKSIAAVNHARQFRPDLVFMDIKMPGPNGLTIARDLRKEPWLRDRPIVFFTGLSNMDESVKQVSRTGPTEFLEKGVSSGVIMQTVCRILSERLALYRATKKAEQN
jgi:CheY-like chemotaxis protein